LQFNSKQLNVDLKGNFQRNYTGYCRNVNPYCPTIVGGKLDNPAKIRFLIAH